MRLAGFFCLCFALAGLSAAQDTNFSTGPQYLNTFGSSMFLRSIATPSLSLGEAPPVVTNATTETASSVTTPVATPSPAADLQNQPNLFSIYYGAPEVEQGSRVIEISAAEPRAGLPSSILDVGVTGTTDPQSLRERGFGMGLAEAAQYWKTHKARAKRVYTNADVERLHRS